MTKEEIREYTLRISQRSKMELIVITLEIIENYLNVAMKGEELVYNVNKAKQFINRLSGCLDFKYPISKELFEACSFL